MAYEHFTMKQTPKALEEGESTFANGGGELGSGSMCGGVMSRSAWNKATNNGADPWGYMMAFIMDDENFALYQRLKSGGKADQKAASELFDKVAISQI